MFWRSVLESYVWGLDLPDSRADCTRVLYRVQICTETHLQISTAAAALALLAVDVKFCRIRDLEAHIIGR